MSASAREALVAAAMAAAFSTAGWFASGWYDNYRDNREHLVRVRRLRMETCERTEDVKQKLQPLATALRERQASQMIPGLSVVRDRARHGWSATASTTDLGSETLRDLMHSMELELRNREWPREIGITSSQIRDYRRSTFEPASEDLMTDPTADSLDNGLKQLSAIRVMLKCGD
jgi:hypothetical protein